MLCASQTTRDHSDPLKVDGRSNSSLTNSKLTWSTQYQVRTGVGRHQPQLMDCLINIQLSCWLYSTSMLLVTLKETKACFDTMVWHRVQRHETYYVAIGDKNTVELVCRVTGWVGSISSSNNHHFSSRMKGATGCYASTATQHHQQSFWKTRKTS